MKKEIQTPLEIYDLINLVQQVEKMGGFIVTHDMIDEDGVEYFENNLTSSYTKFLTDIFQLKYGNITREVIECFGGSIKKTKSEFKLSYSSTVKEIKIDEENSIYVRTPMSKKEIRSMVNKLVKCFGLLSVEHRYGKDEKIENIYDKHFAIRKEQNEDLPF